MSAETQIPNAEERQAQLLEAYLEELQAGRAMDRGRLLGEFPGLAGTLDCLDALDRLAGPAPEDDQQTLTYQPGVVEPAVPPPAAGFAFERYEVIEEIGRGGMGVVFKARHKELDRTVALKMILSSHLASREQIQRFYAEARATARLAHPNVVSIFDIGDCQGHPYFAMRYVAGSTLAGALRAGPLPVERAARLVATVSRAVAYLHAQNVIHRDLKPGNILLDEAGQPYVSDFGLVKILGADQQETATGAILGTASYMPPEQAAGRVGEIGPLADVYALGAILYECLTGRPPFRGPTQLDTLVQVLEGEPVRPRGINPSVPPELEQICLRCLEKEPGQRYPSATALAEDLEHFLKGETIEHQQTSVRVRLQRWSRREPALVSRLAALLICLVVLQVNFSLSGAVTPVIHLANFGILVSWAVLSAFFQYLLNRGRWPAATRLAWSAGDVLLLTLVLLLNDDYHSPLIILYPTLIAGSGLWFQAPLVWLTTVLSMAGYTLLVVEAGGRGVPLPPPRHVVIYLVSLAVVGYVVVYQVNRVRALSRYYENRPLP